MSEPQSNDSLSYQYMASFAVGDKDALETAKSIDATMAELRESVGDVVRTWFMRRGYFNGSADAFVDHEGDWIHCKIVVSCYGLPHKNETQQ